jgi:hypothetical protein
MVASECGGGEEGKEGRSGDRGATCERHGGVLVED